VPINNKLKEINMCFKAAKKIIMAPVRAMQNIVGGIGDVLGLNGSGTATPQTPVVDEIAVADKAATKEAARLRQIEVDRQKAAETALASKAEAARQTEMTANVTGIPLSESLLQRKSKRGGIGRRSLISGSSGGLGFYSRFS
tara:strand:+ start:117 stop:542 length:426 start_codon:yes stop_codon:yes gene_type:complete